jgi:hypothetical protein
MKFLASLVLAGALFASGAANAQKPASIAEVFGRPISDPTRVWIDDAIERYNEATANLKTNWLAAASSARTDLKRRQVIFDSEKGPSVFDAKLIGTYRQVDESWQWVWGWANPTVAVNFRLPAGKLEEAGSTLDLPLLSTGKFLAPSPDLPFVIGAIVLKLHGGTGIHRVQSRAGDFVVDVYYLLSNPRPESGG